MNLGLIPMAGLYELGCWGEEDGADMKPCCCQGMLTLVGMAFMGVNPMGGNPMV